MNQRRLYRLVITLLLLFNGVSTALAMSSTHYRADWLLAAAGGGGGTASSTHYAVQATLGQNVVGSSSSAHYGIGLGYWYGAMSLFRIYLPAVFRSP